MSETRYKVDSLVGTAVILASMDGIPMRVSRDQVPDEALTHTLVEVGPRGFLLRNPFGSLVFASTCSFTAKPDAAEE